MSIDRARRRVLFAGLLLALHGTASAAPPPAGRSLHGVDLPPFVHVEAWDAHLRLAGARVVDHHYMPFQVVALYVGADAPSADLLAAGLARCRIEIHALGPPLGDAEALAFWDARFARAVPDAAVRARLADGLRRFAQAVGAPPRGTVARLDYDPDAGLAIAAGRTPPVRLAGLETVRAILALWLAPGAARDELLAPAPGAAQ